MKMVELQDFLFSQKPNRRQLLAYESELEKSHAIQVFRNHSFELVEHTIDAFLDYAGLGIRFSYSGYDDSFSFSELDKKADAIIIWVDAKRYNAVDTFSEFLEGRLRYLRSIYDRPILLIPSGAEYKSHPGVLVLSLSELEKKLGDKFVDERAAKITGTSLSNLAMVEISRELGLRYLPALLRPSLKAVVVDFDNTLYGGVLGEDGIDGLEITDGHKKLQEYLKALSEKGIFLCASSKNELEDVEKLLESRTDFILRKDDFTKLSVSWQPKSRSMEEISRYLNIGIDSMVMVDDNIGELAEMTMAHPELNIIHAKEDALKTCEVLKSYPRLSIIHAGKEAAMRKGDVIANEKRRNLAQSSSSKEDYIRSLKIVLGYDMDNESSVHRISELSNKTNQFIFNYKRYTVQQVEDMLKSEEYRIVTVSLQDILSDSGLIAACVGKKAADHVVIEECFMSCRALGRGIDDVIIKYAVKLIAESFGLSRVKIEYRDGERNRPAREYIDQYLCEYKNRTGDFSFDVSQDLITINVKVRN